MLANALLQIYPDLRFGPNETGVECAIYRENGVDSIVQWSRPEPQPNEADLLAAFDALAWAKAEKKAELAAARYTAEIGGMVWNNWPVSTDERSRISMLGAVIQVNMGLWSGGWKFADGAFRALTGEQVVAMSASVGAHVAACFAQEATRLVALEAADTLEAINAVVW